MAFYDLPKPERDKLVEDINKKIIADLKSGTSKNIFTYFSDEDTYIRKTAYLSIGKTYEANKGLQRDIITLLNNLLKEDDAKIRQTVINSAGEIGKTDFETVQSFFDIGLFDEHHSVRNAVIGSMKKMGEKNPAPVLKWSKKYLHHEDKEIRREICHGIELRGRTHPQDILPLLKELQNDKTARVKNTLVHVLGQIAYKKGCLETVLNDLKHWDNEEIKEKAIEEIIDVHERYKDFSYYTQVQAIEVIKRIYK
jgi:HEAT repeat protein